MQKLLNREDGKSPKSGRKRAFVKHLGKGLAAILLTGIGLLAFLPMPDFRAQSYATVLEASDGSLLGARIADDGQWRFPKADSVPGKFMQALLLFEDEYFYQHPGINPVSILKALRKNLAAGKVKRGGSTLSMQVIRMARNNPARTLSEKLLEIGLALKLEILYSKEEILGIYAAHAPFGGNVVGLAAAAWRYYGRPPDKLSWGEYATLAVLPNSPSLVYPGKNSPLLLKKRNTLLAKLQSRGLLEPGTARLAQEEPLPGLPKPLPNLALPLINRVIQEGKKGSIIETTIDAGLQAAVKDKVQRYHTLMRDQHVYNAAALVIDIRTGNALAYVGNVDTEGMHGQQVDIITSNRSTGSLLKPLLYAAALDEGLILPRQLLPDIPVFLQGFAPQNFDKKFHGAVPAHEALARSYNVPFVFLLREYGYEKFHQKLQHLGISSLTRPASHYGLSMILGGAESSLWELSAAYAGLGRSLQNYPKRLPGKKYSRADYHPNYYIKQAPAAKEEQHTEKGLFDAWAISQTLQAMQELNRPEEQAGWEAYSSARPIAWKTGTSYGHKDAWAIGLNSSYVVGVWLGNADGEGRPELTGVKAAAPLMFDILELLEKEETFPVPYIGTVMAVCKESGYKAGPNCKLLERGNFPLVSQKTLSCPYHQLLHLDAAGKQQVNSSCYPVSAIRHKTWFVLPAAQAWYYKQFHPAYSEPPEFLAACQEEHRRAAFMELIYPRQFTKLYLPMELDGTPGAAVFEVAHRNPDARIFWHLDQEYIGATSGKHQKSLQPAKGAHTLYLVDEQGRELSLQFEVISN